MRALERKPANLRRRRRRKMSRIRRDSAEDIGDAEEGAGEVAGGKEGEENREVPT